MADTPAFQTAVARLRDVISTRFQLLLNHNSPQPPLITNPTQPVTNPTYQTSFGVPPTKTTHSRTKRKHTRSRARSATRVRGSETATLLAHVSPQQTVSASIILERAVLEEEATVSAEANEAATRRAKREAQRSRRGVRTPEGALHRKDLDISSHHSVDQVLNRSPATPSELDKDPSCSRSRSPCQRHSFGHPIATIQNHEALCPAGSLKAEETSSATHPRSSAVVHTRQAKQHRSHARSHSAPREREARPRSPARQPSPVAFGRSLPPSPPDKYVKHLRQASSAAELQWRCKHNPDRLHPEDRRAFCCQLLEVQLPPCITAAAMAQLRHLFQYYAIEKVDLAQECLSRQRWIQFCSQHGLIDVELEPNHTRSQNHLDLCSNTNEPNAYVWAIVRLQMHRIAVAAIYFEGGVV